MNMKNENKSGTKQKMGFAGCFAALLALCAVSTVYGSETALYEFRPADQVLLETSQNDPNLFDKIDLEKSGRFVSVVGLLAGFSQKEFTRAAQSFFTEAKELARDFRFDEAYGMHDLGKDKLADATMMGKVKDATDKIGLAITITDGVLKIKNAKTEDERVTESCRLALHLFSTALGELIKQPIVGQLISDLGDHSLDHPEDNGFAILVNWVYDNSSLPQILYEWWYDVRYGDSVLQDRDNREVDYGQKYEFIPPDELEDYDDADPEDPFDTLPESNRGCFDGNTSESRCQGLKPLRLID